MVTVYIVSGGRGPYEVRCAIASSRVSRFLVVCLRDVWKEVEGPSFRTRLGAWSLVA